MLARPTPLTRVTNTSCSSIVPYGVLCCCTGAVSGSSIGTCGPLHTNSPRYQLSAELPHSSPFGYFLLLCCCLHLSQRRKNFSRLSPCWRSPRKIFFNRPSDRARVQLHDAMLSFANRHRQLQLHARKVTPSIAPFYFAQVRFSPSLGGGV